MAPLTDEQFDAQVRGAWADTFRSGPGRFLCGLAAVVAGVGCPVLGWETVSAVMAPADGGWVDRLTDVISPGFLCWYSGWIAAVAGYAAVTGRTEGLARRLTLGGPRETVRVGGGRRPAP